MTSKKRLRFGNPNFIQSNRDATEYVFPFTVVDSSIIGAPEEKSETKEHHIIVSITGTLECCWGINQQDIKKVLFEYGKRHIIEKLKDGSLSDKEELWLSTGSHPTTCPFDPSRISEPDGSEIDVTIPEKSIMENQNQIKLASSIIDCRYNINAIFNEKYEEKLLLLTEEKNLLELFREAKSQEDFSYRVCALASIVRSLNINILKKITNISDDSTKSISLLEEYLKFVMLS